MTEPARPDAYATKRELRRWAKALRAEVMAEGRAEIDERVCAAVLAHPAFRRARTVAAYLAFGSEVDLAALFREPGKRFVLPRTNRAPTPHLTLHEVPGEELAAGLGLERHAFGQAEPGAALPAVPPSEVDLFLVPGLAFDERGYRLGFGQGYYDRLLPLAREDAWLVGVTPAALVVPALPAEAHDARLGHLVTEAGWREAASVSDQVG